MADASRFAPGTRIQFKRLPGLGGWERGTVIADDGGHLVEVRPRGAGAVPRLVARARVRVPVESGPAVRQAVAAIQVARWLRETGPLSPPRPVGARPRGRLLSPHYLAYVRALPCCSCGAEVGVQAHHAGRRPVGRKCDDFRTVPLCARCHRHLHATGGLPGAPHLEQAEVRAYLAELQADLLIEYFTAGADLEGAPAERAPLAAGGAR